MKSVSFSDLRNSSSMINRSDQLNNSGDSIIKRSSSYKNLTYYSSSEDILRKFSSKTVDIKGLKDGYKSDDTNSGFSTNQLELISTGKLDEKNVDLKTTNLSITIQDLKALIENQREMISNLEEKNIILQNESAKNMEELKFQENRIKYLEHMLAAFNTNAQENISLQAQTKETNMITSNVSNNVQYKQNNRVISNENNRTENDFIYKTNTTNNKDLINDINKRPNSADSTLQNEYKYNNNILNKKKQDVCNESSLRTYMSDSEERFHSSLINTNGKNPSLNDNVPKQRFQLERERSTDISDIKSRLGEFTKYAKRSIELNSLNQLNSSLPQNYENKRINRYGHCVENNTDSQYKVRTKSTNQSNEARPPIDPYYKQRRTIPNEVKTTHDRTLYPKVQAFTNDEDENLKDRVQKLLEKHKYSTQAYRSEDIHKSSDYNYKGGNDTSNISILSKYERGSTDYIIDYQSKNSLDNNELNIPRTTSTANDLIAKYLNYQGSANVS